MPVEEIVFDFIEECEIPLMKNDSDIDVEEDIPFAGLSRNYILMKSWSFCLSSRSIENRANKIHERALRLVYDDPWNLLFEELLVKGDSVSIHQKTLATEIFKANKGTSKTWELLPGPSKNEICLNSFKLKINFLVTDKCPYRICTKYVGNLGFIYGCSVTC